MHSWVIPRDLRLEVAERTLASGTIRDIVDTQEVRDKARQLLSMGCEAVCLFFINGYANSANEQKAAEAVRAVWPNAYVSVATEIIPEIREFERLSTTALNAVLQPPVAGYLDQLQNRLQEHGFRGDLLIVQSNGGVMSVDSARKTPVRTALSGPAAGVIAAQSIALAAEMPNIVTCDMGGTSFDVSLVADGASTLCAQTSIGFGRSIRTPMIEITTIGAGGGSIARVDIDGILKVGPESAGSDPGPVCYGLGNTLPTVTDANLVLGRINADRPIGGGLSVLDLSAAQSAIAEHIGKPLELDVEHAADAILRVANAHMAGAIRLVSIERGYDPTRFVAMPFGGGGALHTGALIQEVGLQAALVPRYPGITSALGCVVADMRHDRVQTVNQMLSEMDTSELAAQMNDVVEALSSQVKLSSITFEKIEQRFELDMLYVGQTHSVCVVLPQKSAAYSQDEIKNAFDEIYRNTYGRLLEGIPLRVLNFRVIVIGRRPEFEMQMLGDEIANDQNTPQVPSASSHRPVWIAGDFVDTPVYQRDTLRANTILASPALIEQPDTTIFIDPGLSACSDQFGNLIIRRTSAET